MYRIGVTGGRMFKDSGLVFDVLAELLNGYPADELTLVIGDATGVDTFAKIWAEDNDISFDEHKADCDKFGNSAGPIRNRAMLSSGLTMLIAFPGANGTADMVNICREADVFVFNVATDYQKPVPTTVPIESMEEESLFETKNTKYSSDGASFLAAKPDPEILPEIMEIYKKVVPEIIKQATPQFDDELLNKELRDMFAGHKWKR